MSAKSGRLAELVEEIIPSRRQLWFGQVISFGVSIIVGFISYLLNPNLQDSLTLGILTAITLLVIELMSNASLILRELYRSGHRIDSISDSLSMGNGFLRTIDRLHEGGAVGRELENTLREIHSSVADVPPSLFQLVNERLGAVASAVLEKKFTVEGDNMPNLGTLLSQSFERDVFATSLHPLHFWLHPYGQNYHKNACKRMRELPASNVRFRRVFIVREDSVLGITEGAYEEMIREQISVGMHIRVCDESELALDLVRDFGIWDHILEVHLEVDKARQIHRTHYRYSSEAIGAAERRAQRIWDRSVSYDTWVAQHGARR